MLGFNIYPWHVATVRIAFQVIAGEGITPRAIAAADVAKLADAAATLEMVWIARGQKNRDGAGTTSTTESLGNRPQRAAGSRRENLNRVADEHDALVVADAQPGTMAARRGFLVGVAVALPPLGF